MDLSKLVITKALEKYLDITISAILSEPAFEPEIRVFLTTKQKQAFDKLVDEAAKSKMEQHIFQPELRVSTP